MFKNKKLSVSIGLSAFITVLFAIGASLQAGTTRLDMYLGIIWVFVLSMIIAFSLSHYFEKDENDKNQNNHKH